MLQEKVLQIQATGISLALIVVLHLGNLILGCNLEVFIRCLGDTEISYLVGHFVGDLNNGHISQVILAMIHQDLVGTTGFRLKCAILDQILEFGKEVIPQDSPETNLLRLPEGREDIFSGQVVRCGGHTLDKCLRRKENLGHISSHCPLCLHQERKV